MASIDTLFEYLRGAALATLVQLVSVFGGLFLVSLVLTLLARMTRNVFARTWGPKFEIFATGWIGVPVHELGHALFCVLFRHSIQEIRFFSPDPKKGTLGYVLHSYHPRNIYQRIGNLFIGLGPILLGSLVLFAGYYFLVSNQQPMIPVFGSNVQSVAANLQELLSMDHFKTPGFWVFVYLSLCVSSHMELSPADFRGAGTGLLSVILFLFALNLCVKPLGINLTEYVHFLSQKAEVFSGIFLYAMVISALNFMISYVLTALYAGLRLRRLVNPF